MSRWNFMWNFMWNFSSVRTHGLPKARRKASAFLNQGNPSNEVNSLFKHTSTKICHRMFLYQIVCSFKKNEDRVCLFMKFS